MSTPPAAASSNPGIRQFLIANARNHTLRTEETTVSERIEAEILLVRDATVLYITGESVPARLETVKDYLRSLKGNPHGMTVDGSSADAKVQKDMLRICHKELLYQGEKVHIIGKELNRNAVIFLDIDVAAKLISAEKDAKKRAEMQDRLNKVMHLKTREGYERHL